MYTPDTTCRSPALSVTVNASCESSSVSFVDRPAGTVVRVNCRSDGAGMMPGVPAGNATYTCTKFKLSVCEVKLCVCVCVCVCVRVFHTV